MNALRTQLLICLAAALASASTTWAQNTRTQAVSIGYVYPAGARQGATSEHVIAGQRLNGVSSVYVSGGGVTAKITDFIAPNKKQRPANPAICNLVVCSLTIDPDAKPGKREIRVGTKTGLSNPLVFEIGEFPEFSEKPSKDIIEQRSLVARTAVGPKKTKIRPDITVTLPAVVNGQILPGEVDRYRFKARRGQKLVIAVSAQELIPFIADAVPGWFQATLSLYDAHGNELAYADDYRFAPDPIILSEIPADGEYVIEIKDSIYRGREDFVYRIMIGEEPFVTDIFPLGGPSGATTTVELDGWNLPQKQLELNDQGRNPGIYPFWISLKGHASHFIPFAVNNLPEILDAETESKQGNNAAQSVSLPVIINGRIDRSDDVDAFSFTGETGQEIVAEVQARRLNSPLDSALRLIDDNGNEIAFNDDSIDTAAGLVTHHADSYMRVKLPKSGTYRVELRDTQHQGGPNFAYRLRLSQPIPDFALRVTPSAITVPPGGKTPVSIRVVRQDGFDGEISIALKNPAAGFELSQTSVPAGANEVELELSAAPSSPSSEPITVALVGRALINGRQMVRDVVPADDRTQAFVIQHVVPSEELKVLVAGSKFQPSNSKFQSSKGKKTRTIPFEVISDLPIKIPAGGTAELKLDATAKYLAANTKLKLLSAPKGITIKKVTPSDDTIHIVLADDATKLEPGSKGQLTLNAERPGKSKSKKKVLITVPPIPFEITR